MKIEISAGGILIRKHGAIWYVLVLHDMNNTLTFPKGKIEAGEEPLTAAIREIQEEVGLTNVEMLTQLQPVHYTYKRNGLISKTVHYFLFLVSGSEKVIPQKAEGIHDIQWVTLAAAIDNIGYPATNKPLLEETKQWILHSHRT